MAKNDYRQQAEAQYDPSYNARITALKNQLAQNQLSLDQSKTGINQNYDTQVGNQNRNNMINKNNISNTMLGRGLGNSSIVTSGLAESDARNMRLVDTINTARTGALNDIEAQKQMLAQNMNNTLGQMAGDREKELMALANQLEDRDWDKTFKDNQFNWQKEQDLANQGFREKELAMRQKQMEMEQSYKNSMLALEREKFAMQKNGGADPDKLRGTLQAILYDNERTPQEKYGMVKAMKAQYGNKTGFGDFNKEADALLNSLGVSIGTASGMSSTWIKAGDWKNYEKKENVTTKGNNPLTSSSPFNSYKDYKKTAEEFGWIR